MARRRLVEIVNRTTEPLDVMYDGTPDVIPPGYKIVPGEKEGETKAVGAGERGEPLTFTCDYFAAEAYKRQHPRMGTQDPFSVDARDTDYLLGVEEWGDDISHLEQSDADELIDRTALPDHRQNAEVVPVGRSGKSRAVRNKRAQKEARKARAKNKAQAQANRRSKFVDSKLRAPNGNRANYEG